MECITVLPQCRRGIDLRAHRAECQASRLGSHRKLSSSIRAESKRSILRGQGPAAIT